METKAIIDQLEPWRAKHRRPAWKPVVEDGDDPAWASKFCGIPWTSAGTPCPECRHCKQPLQLFLQLDLDSLPDEINKRFGGGLLQLFYCLEDECQSLGGWTPFEDTVSRVRIIPAATPGTPLPAQHATSRFPAKRIVGWRRFLDVPHNADHEELGLKYIYDLGTMTARIECQELGLSFKDLTDPYLPQKIADSASGDKLAGWPHWSQDLEYPTCPKCRRRMILLFQLGSEDNIPYMLGDMGTGHITQCPEHKDVVAFGWACS